MSIVDAFVFGCWLMGHQWRQHKDGVHWVCAWCGAVR